MTDPSAMSSTSNWETFMENSLTNESAMKQAYQHAITEGTHLLTMMRATDDQVYASSFKTPADLAKHGYIESSWSGGTEENEMKDLSPVFHGLNVGPRWAGFQRTHDRASGSKKDVRYPSTNASYTQYCNPTDGVLIAWSNHSVTFEVTTKNISPIVPLRHWCDVAYLQWRQLSGGVTPKPIRYVIRPTITNKPMRDVLWKILEGREIEGNSPCPGLLLDTETNAGKAILGTLNGAATAYMLTQRKAELGNKRIGKIAMYSRKDGGMGGKLLSLCFWIEKTHFVLSVCVVSFSASAFLRFYLRHICATCFVLSLSFP